jgi:drug/metabolite transporter (DMT)-like permease
MLILVAALAHATWNLFSKQASITGAVFFVWLVSAAATALYAPVVLVAVLLQRPHLSGMSWLFMAGTGVLQTGYFLFLQTGYRLGDLSLVYPIGRGTGALLAALAGILLLGERPGPVGITGIGCIVAGIVLIGLPGKTTQRPLEPVAPSGQAAASGPAAAPSGQAAGTGPADRTGPAAAQPAPAWKALTFAIVTGVFIASYTLWDKHAVSTLKTPPLLQGYAAFPVMLVALAPLVLRDSQRLSSVWRSFRPQAIGAAVLAPFAYILVLAALSFTAVSAVAPAREVSVLFGVILGRRLLHEGSLPRRLAAAAAIVVGIVAVAVA